MKSNLLIKILILASIAIAISEKKKFESPKISKGFWVTEDSKYMSINGTEVRCNYTDSSDVSLNAMWKEDVGISADKHYWKFAFSSLERGAFVGLTTEKYFGPSYSLRGLFYGHNLSDGSALLVQGFGPKIKSGDVIGMLVTYKNNSTYIEFDHNEKPLGLAFEVPAKNLQNAYPVIKFWGTGSATCTKSVNVPKSQPRYTPVYEGIEGTWKLAKDNEATCTLVSENENSYRATIHVANIFGTILIHENLIWKVLGIVSTKLKPPPHLATIEKAITDVLESIKDVYLDFTERLHMVGASNELIWIRYDSIPKPYVGEFPSYLDF